MADSTTGLVVLVVHWPDADWSGCWQDESVARLRCLVACDGGVQLGLLVHRLGRRLGSNTRGSLSSRYVWNPVQLKLGSAGLRALVGEGGVEQIQAVFERSLQSWCNGGEEERC